MGALSNLITTKVKLQTALQSSPTKLEALSNLTTTKVHNKASWPAEGLLAPPGPLLDIYVILTVLNYLIVNYRIKVSKYHESKMFCNKKHYTSTNACRVGVIQKLFHVVFECPLI